MGEFRAGKSRQELKTRRPFFPRVSKCLNAQATESNDGLTNIASTQNVHLQPLDSTKYPPAVSVSVLQASGDRLWGDTHLWALSPVQAQDRAPTPPLPTRGSLKE